MVRSCACALWSKRCRDHKMMLLTATYCAWSGDQQRFSSVQGLRQRCGAGILQVRSGIQELDFGITSPFVSLSHDVIEATKDRGLVPEPLSMSPILGGNGVAGRNILRRNRRSRTSLSRTTATTWAMIRRLRRASTTTLGFPPRAPLPHTQPSSSPWQWCGKACLALSLKFAD